MTRRDIEDTAEDEETSTSKVSEAWHDARKHASEMGLHERGNAELNTKPFEKEKGHWSESDSFLSNVSRFFCGNG
ncbi:MAG: hypothetical protein NTZ13_00645 [Candidatus Parcubacteria bacterium]|nr:hypothetical protein [Candidatus Parcubacteria bacterium]